MIYTFSVAGIALVIILLSNCVFKHWLDTTPQTTNPIKLIVRVLNYARKNKYPRNRSALTYWEDNYPSRLDLGMEKYGGPFLEGEVEDVKTVLRLFPILICVVGFCMSWDAFTLSYQASGYPHSYTDSDAVLYSYINNYGISNSICVVLIVIYQLIIYPCLYNYIPSMLKRIALGLVLCFLVNLSYVAIVLVGFLDAPSFECPLGVITSYNLTIVLPIDYKWLIFPQIMFGVAIFLCAITSLEFIVAQSPKQMRGLMAGLWYAAYGFGQLINNNFYLLFSFVSSSYQCVIYMYSANSLCILLILIAFLFLAKRYKLRVRENIVPVHQIAEEHYERYFDQSEAQRREYY